MPQDAACTRGIPVDHGVIATSMLIFVMVVSVLFVVQSQEDDEP